MLAKIKVRIAERTKNSSKIRDVLRSIDGRGGVAVAPGFVSLDLGLLIEPTIMRRLRKTERLGLVIGRHILHGNMVYDLTNAGREIARRA